MFLRSFFAISAFLVFGLNLAHAMDEEATQYTYENLIDEEQEEIYEKYIQLLIVIHDFEMVLEPEVLDFMRKSKDFLRQFMDSRYPLSQKGKRDLRNIMNFNMNSSSDDA